ncbi:nickel pincer cofactor biosynthesis protein LarC [Desulfotruncus alcoholivorax]|uniref:nickel pincer cofactor biosynthesis protein LarC n=1 Tax=Desulfotruncus alcoholivorax TaxID=265477 RepID=UPI0003F9E7A3|nr:nickel pincer cofactor biosynthesis protein LarC [Desulfotruncus alcoholivorax]
MRFAYFDCFSGISGDMILGAFVDLGVELEQLQHGLEKLRLPGFRLEAAAVKRSGLSGTKVNVIVDDAPQPHRNLLDISGIIDRSDLKHNVKDLSLKIFNRLAEAEAKIHGTDINNIHFHEVGGLDSIVDIVGASICMDLLGIEEVYCSKLNVGQGFIKCQHGILPVPAPATLELLRGVPIYAYGSGKELLTPTGAAIITTISGWFGPLPEMVVEKVGYGAGYHDLDLPNMLRILLGTRLPSGEGGKNRHHEHAAHCVTS